MADIFFSYAHEDRELVRELVHILELDGFTVWWDREIHVGKEFADVIEAELHAARVVVVCWSNNSVASHWVKSEAAVGLDRDALIPIALGKCPIPIPFRSLSTAQLIGWPDQPCEIELAKLRRSINDLCDLETIDEQHDLTLDHADPSLSVRVARRVTNMMTQEPADLERQLAFEQVLSEVSIQLVANQSNEQALTLLLARIQRVLDADLSSFTTVGGIVAGNSDMCDAQIVEALPHQIALMTTEDEDADQLAWLQTLGVSWVVVLKDPGMTLCLAGIVSDPPESAIRKRLELLLKLLKVMVV